jgi:hypothetical protein
MDDIFKQAKKQRLMNRKIFILWEGEVTELEFLNELCNYVKANKIPVIINKVDNIHLIGSETEIGTVESVFCQYLSKEHEYLLKDIKTHHDLFLYLLDFDRLRDSYDPLAAKSHCEKLIKFIDFKKIPVKPILSDPAFEYWLYLLAASKMKTEIIANSKSYRSEIINIIPKHIRPTNGEKSYSKSFYEYVLNNANIKQTISASRQQRNSIKQLKSIRNVSDINISENVLNVLIENKVPFTMVDLILQEIIN